MLYNKNVVIDALTLMHDGAEVTASGAGKIDAVPVVWDTANGYTEGRVVVDIESITITDDQLYRVILQGSSEVDFATASKIRDLIEFQLGAGEVLFNGTAANDVGAAGERVIFGFNNQPVETKMQYLRIYFVVSGTIWQR